MPKVADVRLAYNPKILWFDPGDLEFERDYALIVQTARGLEFAHAESAPREVAQEEIDSLNSALKPIKRVATDEDRATYEELQRKGDEALDVFREVVEERKMNMNPVGVEYLFSGDKAVFYFESEERVDFRDLVRDLASRFHVRIDMRQVGVRDKARLVGGYGSCGQELCCRRLGGKFNPVSIRMAKDQDLSLNPQKISGICGRLMCCLRYEEDSYKEFKTRCPKLNAKISTPAGVAKVVEVSMPLEEVTVLTDENKRVRVPLADMTTEREGSVRPDTIPDDVFEDALNGGNRRDTAAEMLVTSMFTGADKVADAPTARHIHERGDEGASGQKDERRSRRRRRGKDYGEQASGQRKSGRDARRRDSETTRQGQGSSSGQGERRQKRRLRTVVVNPDAVQDVEARVRDQQISSSERSARSNRTERNAQEEPSRRQASRRHPGQRSSGLSSQGQPSETSKGSNRSGDATESRRGQGGSRKAGSDNNRSNNRRKGQHAGQEGSTHGGGERRNSQQHAGRPASGGNGGQASRGQGGSNGRNQGGAGGRGSGSQNKRGENGRNRQDGSRNNQGGRGAGASGDRRNGANGEHRNGANNEHRNGANGEQRNEHRTPRRRSHKTQGGGAASGEQSAQ